ncbi:unnamed protein product [Camellia sinensis]
MAKPRKLLFSFSSILMASLFALSASLQFNDPDWYFWIPLYASACAVNLVNGVSEYKIMRPIARFAQWFGFFLLIKVLIEDFVEGIDGFWSLDMRERVVREKFGSGLVIISMFLHFQALSSSSSSVKGKTTEKNEVKVPNYVQYENGSLGGHQLRALFCFLYFPEERNEVLSEQESRSKGGPCNSELHNSTGILLQAVA